MVGTVVTVVMHSWLAIHRSIRFFILNLTALFMLTTVVMARVRKKEAEMRRTNIFTFQ